MPNSSRNRIVIIDDEPSTRTMAPAVLGFQGYQVDFAADGFEGLLVLKQFRLDIIISDLRMPNMNGFEEVLVIAMSGEFFSESGPESVLADAFFAKGSYSPARLFEKISELLRDTAKRRKKTGSPHLQSLSSHLSFWGEHPLSAFTKQSTISAQIMYDTRSPMRSGDGQRRVEKGPKANADGAAQLCSPRVSILV